MADIAICDANILIDLVSAEKGEVIIKALVRYFGKIVVPDIVIQEVHAITVEDAAGFGFTIEPVPFEYLTTDYSDMPSGLSLPDKIILRYVREFKWDCITNDRLLRTWCQKEGVNVYWELQLVIVLVQEHIITKSEALALGDDIHSYNKAITDKVIEDFREKVLNCDI